MSLPVTPAPRRPGRPAASLRTQRPTTYYDPNKHPSPNPNDSSPRAPRPRPGPDGSPQASAPKPSSGRPLQHLVGFPNSIESQSSHDNHPPILARSIDKPLPRSTGRSTEKTKVGVALLNRRQSVSYGHPSLKSTPHPMPPLPPVPNRFGRTKNEDQIVVGPKNSKSIGPTIQIDLETLYQVDFDAEKFMTIHLSTLGGGSSDPQTLKIFKNSLRSAHLTTNQSLQENAYKNYGAFVAVSKEIATLENEMLELKSVLEEFKTLPNDLDMGLGLIHDHNSSGEPKRKAGRNSIADVNALYKNQLQSLWENVEGSQKFLPIQPGRHVVSEIKSFVELNPITYQPKQAVHLFLLDDSLLIAIRKQTRMASGQVKLMAEKCFSLHQISIVGLDDRSDLTNAVQIQRNQEKVILRTDCYQDKREFLHSFRKVYEEISRRKRKQSMVDLGARNSNSELYRAGGTLLPAIDNKVIGSAKDDPTNKICSQVGDLLDETSVAIACRRFEQAFELLEDSRSKLSKLSVEDESGNSHRTGGKSSSNLMGHRHEFYTTFKTRIEERVQELMNRLLEDLSEPSMRKSRLVRVSQLIFRISSSGSGGSGSSSTAGGPFIERAKESFLSMRSDLVRKQIGQIKFEGDHSIWVSQSSFVLFTLVKNTCEWYMTAFRDNRMASGFVSWAVEQIERYGEVFRRQVYDGEENQTKINESISITKVHAGMLKEVGLDFGFLLDSVLNREGHSLLMKNRGAKVRGRSMDGSQGDGERRSIFGLEPTTTNPKGGGSPIHRHPTGIRATTSLGSQRIPNP